LFSLLEKKNAPIVDAGFPGRPLYSVENEQKGDKFSADPEKRLGADIKYVPTEAGFHAFCPPRAHAPVFCLMSFSENPSVCKHRS